MLAHPDFHFHRALNVMYSYLRLSTQPMQIRFEFRPARIKKSPSGSSDARPNYDGRIQVVLSFLEPTLTDSRSFRYVEGGTFATGITTFRSIWEGRKSARVPAESRELIKHIADFQELIETAHGRLTQLGGKLDGQAVMNAVAQLQSGGLISPDGSVAVVTLPKLYEEFMIWKKSRIEPNRRKRKDDQISQATYDTYPKRWVQIMGYLASIQRTKLPVGSVNTPFTTNLKEWLGMQQQVSGKPYDVATINKVISLLKMLMTYADSKGYIQGSPIRDFACRGGSPANPKPLTESHMERLESCELPAFLRHICDSWLVAAELCLHYADYMELKTAEFTSMAGGKRIIQLERSKQSGTTLKQTVNVTARAERILEKWGGVGNLYYKSSANFSKALKQIARLAGIRDSEGEIIGLQFGQGRDTGLTNRAIAGANTTQLTHLGGWSKAAYANRYIGLHHQIIAGFVEGLEEGKESTG